MTEPNDPKNADERPSSDLPDPDWDELEPNDPDDELLFSLLDGELTDEKRREVERRLKEDPAFASRCDKLRQACAIIDSLSPLPDNPELRTTTMAYVSEDAQKENEIRAKRERRRLFWICLAMLAAAMAAFGSCGWLAARYYARRDAARELSPRADGGSPEAQNPRQGWPPGYPGASQPPGPPRGIYEGNRRPGSGRGRRRDIKSVLPEELREENLGALDGELLEFGKNIPADDPVRGLPDAKERILYRFIAERGVDSFTALLSDRGKSYVEPLPEEQKIRLIGLLILTGLYERLGPQSPAGPRPAAGPPRDFENRRGSGETRPPRDFPPSERGFFWRNETTSELAKTLRGLPERQRDELLRLPDDEMYARLLVLHWGIDPQMGRQENDGPPPPRRPYSYNQRGRTIDDWNRFVDDEASGGREAEGRGGTESGEENNNNAENNGGAEKNQNHAEENGAEENTSPAPEESAPGGEAGEP